MALVYNSDIAVIGKSGNSSLELIYENEIGIFNKASELVSTNKAPNIMQIMNDAKKVFRFGSTCTVIGKHSVTMVNLFNQEYSTPTVYQFNVFIKNEIIEKLSANEIIVVNKYLSFYYNGKIYQYEKNEWTKETKLTKFKLPNHQHLVRFFGSDKCDLIIDNKVERYNLIKNETTDPKMRVYLASENSFICFNQFSDCYLKYNNCFNKYSICEEAFVKEKIVELCGYFVFANEDGVLYYIGDDSKLQELSTDCEPFLLNSRKVKSARKI